MFYQAFLMPSGVIFPPSLIFYISRLAHLLYYTALLIKI